LAELAKLPFTVKDELQPEGVEAFAANRTFPLEAYTRFHETSGTRGRPLAVLDTPEDWQWWIEGWQFVLDAAEIAPGDRALLAFSFGPFIGFWSAFDALLSRGAMAIPGGGLGSLARIELLRKSGATALFCTPTYALRLAEVAAENKIELSHLPVKKIVVAGEPGGSVPAIRARIEGAWGAAVVDHAGATEVGPWGFADAEGHGLFVNESEFIAEFFSVETGAEARDGELAHLVLTTLGRMGAPVIRYRTGDLVRPTWQAEGANRFVLLEGGVLGRADDMMIIRGVNVFPTQIEELILKDAALAPHYQIEISRPKNLDEMTILIERAPGAGSADGDRAGERLAHLVKNLIGVTAQVRVLAPGGVERSLGKARRIVDKRPKS
jgi:phenylacetate-CoA ligase